MTDTIDLTFLGQQLIRLQDDNRVLTAMVMRLDSTVNAVHSTMGAILVELRAMHVKLAHMDERLAHIEGRGQL